jgi:hypothetical protein
MYLNDLSPAPGLVASSTVRAVVMVAGWVRLVVAATKVAPFRWVHCSGFEGTALPAPSSAQVRLVSLKAMDRAQVRTSELNELKVDC